MSKMPWSPRTRQQKGLKTEKQIVTGKGAKVHPRSGAGSIKDDGSDEDTVYEIKDAVKTHTIKGLELLTLFKRATRQGKEAQYIVYFEDADVTLTGTITRGKG